MIAKCKDCLFDFQLDASTIGNAGQSIDKRQFTRFAHVATHAQNLDSSAGETDELYLFLRSALSDFGIQSTDCAKCRAIGRDQWSTKIKSNPRRIFHERIRGKTIIGSGIFYQKRISTLDCAGAERVFIGYITEHAASHADMMRHTLIDKRHRCHGHTKRR